MLNRFVVEGGGKINRAVFILTRDRFKVRGSLPANVSNYAAVMIMSMLV
jgi:hypothetical protein